MTTDTTDYFGHDLSHVECERLMLEHITDPKLYSGESELFATKWWDYRALHPVKATYLFAHHYRASYRALTQQRDDVDKGRYVRGFKGDDLFELSARERNGFWKARRQADTLGIPYDFYTDAAMRHADSMLWKRLPRPTQLYSAEFIEVIEQKWQEINAAMTVLPTSSRFLVESYVQAEDQRNFQEWLCFRIEQSNHPVAALNQHVFEEPRLPLDMAIDRFGSALVEQARYF